MKKSASFCCFDAGWRWLFALAGVLALTIGARGQALVQLRNSFATLVSYRTSNPVWPAPGSLFFALLTAPPGTTDLSRFVPTGLLATNLALEGRVFGLPTVVPGWPDGENRAFAIVGWAASHGPNFNMAWLGQGCIIKGVSIIGSGTPGGGIPFNPFAILGTGFTIDGPLTPEFCPGFFVQPVSQSARYGSTVTFSALATSGTLPLRYQWQFNGTNLPGATSDVLVLTNVGPAQAGPYWVTAFTGLAAVSSSVATLDLYGAPMITVPPQSQTVSVGAGVKFEVSVVGSPPPILAWYFNRTTQLSGATNSVLQLANVQLLQAGEYTVAAHNDFGSVTSAPAVLTVSALPAILNQPLGRSVPAGSIVYFSVLAAGEPPLSYQWYFNATNACASGTNATLKLVSVQPDAAGAYTVVVTNAFGSVTSATAVLAVSGSPPAGEVVAWGWNSSGQADVPPGVSNVVALAGGDQHNLALTADGMIIGWGDIGFGVTQVPPDLGKVTAISAGSYHNLVLKEDGTVVSWGWNLDGQTNVPADLREVVAVSAGMMHSLALKANGTVAAWGRNDHGQGDVPPGVSNVIAISAGAGHNLALKADHSVIAWGENDSGACDVPGGLSNVVAIAAGAGHSLALQSDGTVVAWGFTGYGEGAVPPGLANVIGIAAGSYHNLALKADHTVVAWGNNFYNQTSLPAGLSNVLAVARGDYHSLALVGAPPVARVFPNSQTAELGSRVTFHAQAEGTLPLTCCWFHERTNTVGGPSTQLQLVMRSVQAADAGTYTVVVSNVFGTVTSSAAILAVTPAIETRVVPGLLITTRPGTLVDIEHSDGLGRSDWSAFPVLDIATSPQFFFDLSSPLPAQRFYRASSTPSAPAIALQSVPAITLTGSVGNSVQIDYINQFGPTDAWMPLARVMLTNESQLYLDTSASGAPARLYRLMEAP